MTRRLGITTVVIGLCLTGSAHAARAVSGGPNTYTTTVTVTGGGGARHRPVAVSVAQRLTITNTTPSDVAAPLVDARTRIRGLRIPFARLFPTCSAARITVDRGNNGRWNRVCPTGSLVATGNVYAVLTSPASKLAGPGVPCHLRLWVYNDGPGRLTLFLTAVRQGCSGLATGDASPWQATYRQAGAFLVSDVPEPADVSYDAGRVGLFGSLERESLVFRRLSVRRGRRLYPFIESTGCPRHGRPYTVRYTATRSAGGAPAGTATISGRAGCGRP